jgi:hypothetical protein
MKAATSILLKLPRLPSHAVQWRPKSVLPRMEAHSMPTSA